MGHEVWGVCEEETGVVAGGTLCIGGILLLCFAPKARVLPDARLRAYIVPSFILPSSTRAPSPLFPGYVIHCNRTVYPLFQHLDSCITTGVDGMILTPI